ncbi:MAG TPA: MBL fold metallo-hydrolase [Planctomycetota bacterium]|nr:MBL fold metallo-hydrolase [Planctomycetota bacterium]
MHRMITLTVLVLGLASSIVRAEEKAVPPPPSTDLAVTWWGCMSVEVNIGEASILFDPYVKPDEPRFDFIFCSHDHYDHCHEETLRKLIVPWDTRFKLLMASRACFYASRIEGPNNWGDCLLSDLSFVPRDKCIALYPKYMDTVSPHIRHENEPAAYPGPTELVLGRLQVEAFRAHEDARPGPMYRGEMRICPSRPKELSGPWPNLGYLVTDSVTGRSFAHTGDIWNAYPEMQKLRGKVDVLFYPLGKLPLDEKVKMMDYIRPKIAIPTHYRMLEPDFPIPATYLAKMKEEDVYKSPENEREAILGNWYPSSADPVKDIAEQREKVKEFTRVIELKAGVRYVLPEKLEEFRGRER